MPTYKRKTDKLTWSLADQIQALRHHCFVRLKRIQEHGCSYDRAEIILLGKLTRPMLALSMFRRDTTFYARLADFEHQQNTHGWSGAWEPHTRVLTRVRVLARREEILKPRPWSVRRRQRSMSPEDRARDNLIREVNSRVTKLDAHIAALQLHQIEITDQLKSLPNQLDAIVLSIRKAKIKRAELLTKLHGDIQ